MFRKYTVKIVKYGVNDKRDFYQIHSKNNGVMEKL